MKFLIYKASGGLAHMIKGLSFAITYCRKYHRVLIIDTVTHGAFGDNFSNWFKINDNSVKYSENYDDLDKSLLFYDLTLEQYQKTSIRYDRTTHSYKLAERIVSEISNHNDQLVIYGGSGGKDYDINIKVIDSVKHKIKSQFSVPDSKYIAVHFRNTDIKNNLKDFAAKIRKAAQKYKINLVYLATDDQNLDLKIDNLEIIQYTKPSFTSGHNVHYGCKDKYKVTFDCLTDIYMILHSSYFIPSKNSGLSQWIIAMIKNKVNIFDICSKTVITI